MLQSCFRFIVTYRQKKLNLFASFEQKSRGYFRHLSGLWKYPLFWIIYNIWSYAFSIRIAHTLYSGILAYLSSAAYVRITSSIHEPSPRPQPANRTKYFICFHLHNSRFANDFSLIRLISLMQYIFADNSSLEMSLHPFLKPCLWDIFRPFASVEKILVS